MTTLSKKIITLDIRGSKIDCELKEHPRARRMILALSAQGRLRATKPKRVSYKTLESYVYSQQHWIEKHVESYRNRKQVSGNDLSVQNATHYQEHKEAARTLVTELVHSYNEYYGYVFNRISIKNLSSRWGSCSSKGNLNFHYKILFLPESLQNYLVVHELCHLKELNHSSSFWKLVSETIGDYKKREKELKKIIT